MANKHGASAERPIGAHLGECTPIGEFRAGENSAARTRRQLGHPLAYGPHRQNQSRTALPLTAAVSVERSYEFYWKYQTRSGLVTVARASDENPTQIAAAKPSRNCIGRSTRKSGLRCGAKRREHHPMRPCISSLSRCSGLRPQRYRSCPCANWMHQRILQEDAAALSVAPAKSEQLQGQQAGDRS